MGFNSVFKGSREENVMKVFRRKEIAGIFGHKRKEES
jgi:hypothetical protein